MALGTAMAIAGGAAALGGGVGNYLANKSAAERAEMLQNQGLQDWLNVIVPDPSQQKLYLEEFVSQGKINPVLEKAIKADPSSFEKITTDMGQRNAQNRALSELEGIGYSGGLRLSDKAALQEVMQDTAAKERGSRLAIEADMARRGQGGSGFSVASQLANQSSAADRNANASMKTAADSQDRALQAIMGAGDMATKFRSQDFGEQAQKAAAADKINLFNTEALQGVQTRNTAMQNRAQETNLTNAQRIADQNTQLRNTEQQYNKELAQRQFDNQAKKAAGVSGQYGQLAGTAMQQGQNLGNLFSNTGAGLAGIGSSIAQNDFWDKYLKQKK